MDQTRCRRMRRKERDECGLGARNYFVDFPPSGLDARYVVQSWRVFPKRSGLDIVYEAYGTEIHVLVA